MNRLARPATEPAVKSTRLSALDWMRGFVMVLMTIDHAAMAFDGGHLSTDSIFSYKPGMELPAAQFLTRWITHICAPTFLFLAGTAAALSVEKSLDKGMSERALDRHFLIRGLIIISLDPLWMSLVVEGYTLQVMYAIGMSFICMIPLRRLSTNRLIYLALGLIVCGEALFLAAQTLGNGPTVAGALLIGVGFFDGLAIVYPLLPWLSMMILGWVFGNYLTDWRRQGTLPVKPQQFLLVCGLCALFVFILIRAINGYGNMLLLRDDLSLIQWLHVSKYPPSISFIALELGLMALILSLFFRLQHSRPNLPILKPLLIFGQTALFFYLIHAHLLMFTAKALGLHRALTMGATYTATAAALIIMYPLCRWYRSYKAAHPGGWTRYI